jgi:hypothetical protein
VLSPSGGKMRKPGKTMAGWVFPWLGSGFGARFGGMWKPGTADEWVEV